MEGDLPSLAAVAAGLGSAVTYAALVILSKRLLAAATPPLTVAFWDRLVGTGAVAPVLFLDRVVPRVVRSGLWRSLGVVFTGVSTLIYATLLRRVAAQSAGVLTFLSPLRVCCSHG